MLAQLFGKVGFSSMLGIQHLADREAGCRLRSHAANVGTDEGFGKTEPVLIGAKRRRSSNGCEAFGARSLASEIAPAITA